MMGTLMCHSGTLAGSIAGLVFVVSSIGGLGLLAVLGLLRTNRPAATG